MIRVGILTVSTKGAAGEREDTSGDLLEQMAGDDLAGGAVVVRSLVPDDVQQIRDVLIHWADEVKLDLILTTGGTGFSPFDLTPEATREVIERETPGLVFAMLREGLGKTPHAMLSRAMAGIRGQTLIVNLPGSPKGVRENLQAILPALPHGIELLQDVRGAAERHGFRGAEQ
ncbi:MAG: MogA/MoaB family molybdenum cofactor biosynthesis protein [Anaerolineae bacterium]